MKEDVVDRLAIAQLKDTLTREQCEQLLEVFDVQQQKCVADVAAAIERGDSEEARRVAHLLKGSSASIGAVRLQGFCQDLEGAIRGGIVVSEAQVAELGVVAGEARDALVQGLT